MLDIQAGRMLERSWPRDCLLRGAAGRGSCSLRQSALFDDGDWLEAAAALRTVKPGPVSPRSVDAGGSDAQRVWGLNCTVCLEVEVSGTTDCNFFVLKIVGI